MIILHANCFVIYIQTRPVQTGFKIAVNLGFFLPLLKFYLNHWKNSCGHPRKRFNLTFCVLLFSLLGETGVWESEDFSDLDALGTFAPAKPRFIQTQTNYG